MVLRFGEVRSLQGRRKMSFTLSPLMPRRGEREMEAGGDKEGEWKQTRGNTTRKRIFINAGMVEDSRTQRVP